MKRLVYSLIMVLFALSINAQTSFVASGLKYVNYEGNLVYCDGLAASASAATSITVPAMVSNGSTNYIVKRIATNAFLNNTTLQRVAIYCEEVSVSAFRGCTSIVVINLNEGVTTLGNGAFAKTAVTTVDFPSTLISCDPMAFENVNTLGTITVNSNNETYSSYNGMLFSKDQKTLVMVPRAWHSSINDQAHVNALSVDDLPQITKIGPRALAGNKNLKYLTIPWGVTEIGNAAFQNSKLSVISFPSTIAKIGVNSVNITPDESGLVLNCAFMYPSIDENAFNTTTTNPIIVKFPTKHYKENFSNNKGFLNLKNVTFKVDPSNACDMKADGHCYVVYGEVGYSLNASLVGLEAGTTALNITGGVHDSRYSARYWFWPDKVADDACFGNSSLKSVNITSDEFVKIGSYSFSECHNLTTVNISAPATIEWFALNDCSNLTSVTLDKVKKIEKGVFYGTNIKTITIPASTEIIEPEAFSGSALEKFYVNSSNKNFTAQYGWLYSKDYETLVCVPQNTSKTFFGNDDPKIKNIAPSAFRGNRNVIDVDLPYGLISIGGHAFANSSIESVKIPSSIGTDKYSWGADHAELQNGGEVFMGCKSLKYLSINTLPFEINLKFLEDVPTTCKLYVRNNFADYLGGPKDWKQYNFWKNLDIQPGAYDFVDNASGHPALPYTVNGDEVEVVYGVRNGVVIRPTNSFINVPERIHIYNNGKPQDVTTLGCQAFYGNTTVQEIKLPESITQFKGTTDYVYGNNEKNGYTFAECTNLTKLTVPSRVETIPKGCFKYTKLSDITLPYGVLSVGPEAFSNHTTSVLVPSSVGGFDGSALIGATGLLKLFLNVQTPCNVSDVNIKNQLPNLTNLKTYIPYNLYTSYNTSSNWYKQHGTVARGAYDIKWSYDGTEGRYGYYNVTKPSDYYTGHPDGEPGECTFVYGPEQQNLTWVYFGYQFQDTMFGRGYKSTDIQSYAFNNCTNLNGVTLLDTLRTIPDGAFLGALQLTSFPFSDSKCQLERIGNYAFFYSGLAGDITLSETLKSIGTEAFGQDSNLNSLTLLSTDMTYSSYMPYSDMSSNFRCYVDLGEYFDTRFTLLQDNRRADELQLLPFVRSAGRWTTLSQVDFWDGNGGLVANPSLSFANILSEGGRLYEVKSSNVESFGTYGKLDIQEINPVMGAALSSRIGLLAELEPGKVYKLSRVPLDNYIAGSNLLLPTSLTFGDDATCEPFKVNYGTDEDPYTYELDEAADDPLFIKVTEPSRYGKLGKAYLSLKNTGLSVSDLPMILSKADVIDGVSSLPAAQDDEQPGIYNLAGQRLEKMQKGINIVNGKKVMIK